MIQVCANVGEERGAGGIKGEMSNDRASARFSCRG